MPWNNFFLCFFTDNCKKDPNCFFCDTLKQCFSIFVAPPHPKCKHTCTTQCSVYSSCEACSAQDACSWCSLTSTCYPRSIITDECRVNTETWWGSRNTTLISSPTECGALDTPPGFTAIRYKKPANKEYPDYVKVEAKTEWDDGVPYGSMEVYWRARIYPFVVLGRYGASKLLVRSTALGADILISVANESSVLVSFGSSISAPYYTV